MEKEATAEIYKEMIFVEDVCKIVGTPDNYKIFIFDRNQYVPFNEKDMTFKDAYKYLDAIQTVINSVRDNNFSQKMRSNAVVEYVLNRAKYVFRKGYNDAYAKYQNDAEAMETILRVAKRGGWMKLPSKVNDALLQAEASRVALAERFEDLVVESGDYIASRDKWTQKVEQSGMKPAGRK